MTEKNVTRERERGAKERSCYEMLLKQRIDFFERQEVGPVVIKAADREYQYNRQGRLAYFLEPLTHPETPLQDWWVFSHDVRTQSGKHRHQGGIIIYVTEGKGYSVIDGERVDWEEGDLLLLPIKPKGVEHQHFNSDPSKPCHWVAFLHVPIMDYLATEMAQVENSPYV